MQDYVLEIPTLKDCIDEYDVEAVHNASAGYDSAEIVAFGTSIYQGARPAAYDSHRKISAALGAEFGPNLWILPTNARMAYPYSALYAIASAFKTEQQVGRKFDWLFWVDDDVIVPTSAYRTLRDAADAVERPFVAAVGYDRRPPFHAAVWEWETTDAGLKLYRPWIDAKESGVHKVACTGLCAAVFHRSLFERVPEPWFAVVPAQVNHESGGISKGINPDTWWSRQCEKADVPVYVSCDLDVVHIGPNVPVCRETAKKLRQVFV